VVIPNLRLSTRAHELDDEFSVSRNKKNLKMSESILTPEDPMMASLNYMNAVNGAKGSVTNRDV
jgi:hypothetical protein